MALTKITGEGVGAVDNLTVSPSSGAAVGAVGAIAGQSAYVSIRGNNATFLTDSFDISQLSNGSAEVMQRANHPLIIGTNNVEAARFDSAGNLMVAVQTANAEGGVTIDRDGALNGTSQIRFNRANTTATSFPLSFMNASTSVGHISYTDTATTFATSSDHRLKESVVDMTGAITRVKQLAPKRFNFIANADITVDGFIAHEAQTVVPEAVTGIHNEVEVWREGEELPDGISVGDNKLDEDGNTIPVMQGIDQSKLVPLLTGALQEAIAKIETLETENSTQATQIADLITRVTALENV
jgi:hypothetical protein